MAEEEKEEGQEEKKGGGGGNMVLIIVIVLLVLILIGGAVAAYFLLTGDEEEADANKNEQAVETVDNEANAKKAAVSKRVADLLNVGPMYPLDQFIVNLLRDNGSRFLKVKIDLELDNQEMTAEVDKKVPIIRDVIIKTLSSKTFEEISTLKGKEKLKDELVENLNAFMTAGKIRNVFFTEFVVQ